MVQRHFKNGESIVKSGRKSDEIFILECGEAEGTLNVCSSGMSHPPYSSFTNLVCQVTDSFSTVVRTLTPPTTFGEISLMFNTKTTADLGINAEILANV